MRALEFLIEGCKCKACNGTGNIKTATCHKCSGAGTTYLIDEDAAGVLTKQNTTADVKKGTLRKVGKAFGFDITDGGIPPIVSKDSANTR